MPKIAELPLYRIIQEGLNNVGQHGASSVVVQLMADPAGGVVVSVHDDGCGFDPGQLGPVDQAGHFGLRQMRERIQDLASDFMRVRLGIGRPPDKSRVEGYVLEPFKSDEEVSLLPEVVRTAAEAVSEIILSGIEKAMAKYHKIILVKSSEKEGK